MGQAVSISRTKNDFELVIRATKELEWILETQFGAPNGKTVGLHDKISAARVPGSAQPLPEAVTRKMRKLVTIRNSLVHDREVNAIADRAMFVKDWQEVRHRTVKTPWLARSSPRGHPPLWKPTRLLSTTLWAQKSALALVGVKHGCGAALAPSVADSAAFGHSGTSAHYWMAAGAMALLALACGAVFVGAAAPKGEAVTEGMGAEAGETSLDVEHTRGTHVSTRR